MRVLALGGAGGMGRYACRVAAGWPEVTELVVADLAAGAARDFAAELGPRAHGLGLDVRDAPALAAALAEADVVVNTVGPYFRFGVPILTAAIDAGCHYLDICDDWEPTLDMLELTERARAAGVTAVVGMGASPGVANLLAVQAAAALERPEEIVTGWNLEAAQPDEAGGAGGAAEVSAALIHGVRQMTGTIRVVRDGRPVDERPLRRFTVDYPGVGPRPLWTFGHPEAVTLAGVIPGARTSVNAMFAGGAFIGLVRALRWAVDRRVLTPERAARVIALAERRLPAPAPHTLLRPDGLPPLFGLVTGSHEGRPGRAAATLLRAPGMTMGALTGVPLAVALRLLVTGRLARPGVSPPEAALDPAEFFAELAEHCPGAGPMTLLTTSWEPSAGERYRAAIDAARAELAAG